MHNPTLVGSHRSHRNLASLGSCTIGSRLRNGFYLLPLPALVSLDIDNNRIPVTKLATRNGAYQELYGIKRAAMTSNQNSKIISSDVEDKLAFVAVILVDGDITNIERLENGLQDFYCRICNLINVNLGTSVGIFGFILSGFFMRQRSILQQFFLRLLVECRILGIARNVLLCLLLDDVFQYLFFVTVIEH